MSAQPCASTSQLRAKANTAFSSTGKVSYAEEVFDAGYPERWIIDERSDAQTARASILVGPWRFTGRRPEARLYEASHDGVPMGRLDAPLEAVADYLTK